MQRWRSSRILPAQRAALSQQAPTLVVVVAAVDDGRLILATISMRRDENRVIYVRLTFAIGLPAAEAIAKVAKQKWFCIKSKLARSIEGAKINKLNLVLARDFGT